MKSIRKIQGMTLAVFLALSMSLTGCGGQSQKETSTSAASGKDTETSKSTASSAEKESLKPYVIDWYYVGNGPQAEQALIEEELNKDITDINATVKLHPYDWGTYTQKMQTNLATGEKVDLFFSCSWGSNIYGNVKSGYVVDITDMLDKYAPHAKEVLKGGFLEGSRINGRNYALPCNKEKAVAIGVLFNKKLVDKYGFDISKVNKLEDLEPMFKVIKEKEPNVYACEHSAANMLVSLNASSVPGISYDLVGGTDKFIPYYEDKYRLNLWKVMHDYYKKGYVRKDAATVKDFTPDQKAGKIFAQFVGIKPGKDAEVTASTGVEWVQQPLSNTYSRTDDLVGSMMAVGKSSKDPERVLMFYDKFYNDEKIINTMDFGIEGKHYVKKGDKTIDYAPETDGGKKSGWNPGTPWMFGDQFKSYLFTNEDPEKWKKFQQFNDSAKVSACNGFVINSDNFRNESTAISNVINEFNFGLETGTMDPDVYVPKYTEKLKAAGIEKVLAEVNKQYSDWKAANNK